MAVTAGRALEAAETVDLPSQRRQEGLATEGDSRPHVVSHDRRQARGRLHQRPDRQVAPPQVDAVETDAGGLVAETWSPMSSATAAGVGTVVRTTSNGRLPTRHAVVERRDGLRHHRAGEVAWVVGVETQPGLHRETQAVHAHELGEGIQVAVLDVRLGGRHPRGEPRDPRGAAKSVDSALTCRFVVEGTVWRV